MPIRSPRVTRKVKSRMIVRSSEAALETCSASITTLVLRVVAADRERGGALRPDHRGALGAHLLQLGEPALVAPAAAGDAALQPMLLDLELGVEPLGVALFLGVDLLGPRLEPAEADLGAAQLRRGRATASAWSAGSGRCGRG